MVKNQKLALSPTNSPFSEYKEQNPIPAATVGKSTYRESNVLRGRGGGTNVHPGNRTFRELIDLHRRPYLTARKNNKPEILRSIVRTICEANGKFLRKDEKSGLWFEIGDDVAREKTSQVLRQRAPKMRKILLDSEVEEAKGVVAQQNPQGQEQQSVNMAAPVVANR